MNLVPFSCGHLSLKHLCFSQQSYGIKEKGVWAAVLLSSGVFLSHEKMTRAAAWPAAGVAEELCWIEHIHSTVLLFYQFRCAGL